MSKKPIMNLVKEVFKKKPLPPGAIFREKTSFAMIIIIYALAILAIIIIWRFYLTAAPIITAQATAFFKGLKAELVDGILNKLVNFAYFLIIILPVFFHVRRELTSYTLTKDELVIKKGVLVRKESFVPLSKILTVSVHTNILGQLAKYGTIYIDVGSYSYPITLEQVSMPKELAGKILKELKPGNKE